MEGGEILMQSGIEVSLLIPTHNNSDTVYAAIRSCIQQTFRNIEILVYDEDSTDGTRDIIYKAAAEDSRIRVMTSETNSGPVLAWRKLLVEAKGKYFTFVWSDDLILPTYVEKMKAVLDKNPNHLLTGCGAFVEPAPAQQSEGNYTPHPERKQIYIFNDICLPGDVYSLGVLAGYYPITQICSLYRTVEAREVFDHYVQFENPYGFDYSRRAYGNEVSFLSELAFRSGKVKLLGEPLVVLRASPGSMTVRAMASHKFDFWLQYVWAITAAWKRCEKLATNGPRLVKIATDRLHLCDSVAAVANRRPPRHCNVVRIVCALLFLVRFDRRINKRAKIENLMQWMASRS